VEASPVIGVAEQLQGRGAALERAGHLEHVDGPAAVLLAQRVEELSGGPDVEAALLTLAVGVERRGKSALGRAQLAQHPLRDAGRDPVAERGAPLGVAAE